MFKRYPYVVCPACQTPNRWTQPRCTRCGKPLPRDEPARSERMHADTDGWGCVRAVLLRILAAFVVAALLQGFPGGNM